jgi:N-acetylglucosamine malate deacetylase 2
MATEQTALTRTAGDALLSSGGAGQQGQGSSRGELRTELPHVRSLLAVVRHPGEESSYLGALLSAFRGSGTELDLLVLTGGDTDASDPPTGRLDMPHPAELEMACLALRVSTRAVAAYAESDLGSLPVVELAERIDRMIVSGGPELLLVADGAGAYGSRVVELVGAAAAARNIPALAWTLPLEVAEKIQAETGVPVNGTPMEKIDFRVRVVRDAQWFAMKAYGGQADHGAPHRDRLAAQGSYEWLRWLTPGPQPALPTGRAPGD